MARVEFSKATKREIYIRAGGPETPHCECCGMPVKNKCFEYDHICEEWERTDGREKLTAADGQLLCIPCHDKKTARKTSERAHVTARFEKTANIRKKSSRPIPGSRRSGVRKRMNGDVEKW